MNKEALPTDPSIQAPFVPFETLQLRIKADKLHSLWKEFIDLLEITEESDSGNKFRPNYIGSCRALDGQRMNQIIKEAKELIVSTPSEITFNRSSREVLRITSDGYIVAGEGLSKEEATQETVKLLMAAFEKEIQEMVDARIAAERKKVRVLRKALENVKDSICRDIPDGYSQPCVDQSADECDKIIEQAMKETSK